MPRVLGSLRKVFRGWTRLLNNPSPANNHHPSSNDVGHSSSNDVDHSTAKDVDHSLASSNDVDHSSSNDVGHSSSNLELRKEFRSILALLTLVTSMNWGRPVLETDRDEFTKFMQKRQPDKAHKERLQVLNALTAYMVRGTEVVATTASVSPLSSQPGYSLQVIYAADDPQCKPETTSKGPPNIILRNVIATSNSERKVKWPPENTSGVMLSDRGVSCLSEVLKSDKWGYIDLIVDSRKRSEPLRSSLSDHVATLAEYLQMYRERLDERPLLFDKFTEYIIVTCVHKMYKRMFHWSSRGFLYCLRRIKSDAFSQLSYQETCRNIIQSTEFQQKGNLTRGSNADVTLGELIQKNALHVQSLTQNDFVQQLQIAIGKSSFAANYPPINTYYNVNTFVAFHTFLVAALNVYSSKVKNFFEAMKKNSDGMTLKDAANELFVTSKLLWSISRSAVLRIHLILLAESKALFVPNAVDMDKYLGQRGAGEEENGGEDEDAGEDDLVHQGDFKEPRAYTATEYSDAFERWIKLLVKHLEALYTLSSLSKSNQFALNGRDFSLVMVQAPQDSSTEPWDKTVKKACEAAENAVYDPNLFIDTLAMRLKELSAKGGQVHHEIRKRLFKNKGNSDEAPKKGSKKGAKKGSEDSEKESDDFDCLPFSGAVHCEAVLGSLVFYNSLDDNMKAIVENLKASINASFTVSKLCCPVCWSLMLALDPQSAYNMRGRHHTLSHVELPFWLPNSIIETLVKQYRGYLCQELATLANRKEVVDYRRTSRESDSAISMASEDSTLNDATQPFDGRRFPDNFYDDSFAEE